MQTKLFVQQTENIKIVINKTIGTYDITVVKVNDQNEFVTWVEKYISEDSGITTIKIRTNSLMLIKKHDQ